MPKDLSQNSLIELLHSVHSALCNVSIFTGNYNQKTKICCCHIVTHHQYGSPLLYGPCARHTLSHVPLSLLPANYGLLIGMPQTCLLDLSLERRRWKMCDRAASFTSDHAPAITHVALSCDVNIGNNEVYHFLLLLRYA